jgi:AraC-like DNA-binding protein
MTAVQDPLHRFSVFRTSNIDELQAVGLTRFGATRVALAGRGNFEAQVSFVELRDIALAFGATSSGMRIEQPETDFVRLQIALKGSAATRTGRHLTAIDHRQACMTSANNATVMDCDGGHERFTLRVNNAALQRKLASLVGGRPKGSLEFEATLNMEQPRAQTLLRLLLFFGQELNSAGSELPAIVRAEMEQSIMVTLLSAGRHSLSGLLDHDSRDAAAPWQVRIAEEYIVANCNRPILIEELTAMTGVSARCLFKSFKRSRNYTPMGFAKLARLRRAQQIFSGADERTTVAGTAFSCGFSNLGHFAKDYRHAFGELPSETLGRCRGEPPRGCATRSSSGRSVVGLPGLEPGTRPL